MLSAIIVTILLVYFFCRITCGLNKSATCLVGKTALITGGNAGIGYQVAQNLASRGCRVIIAARHNLEEAKQKLIKETKNPNIITKKVDLLSLKGVRQFAEEIKSVEPKLDILINNSGVSALPFKLTEDGLHPIMQVNHFGSFLLTHLLLDLLKKSGSSRIIFTTSNLAYLGYLTLNTIKVPKFETWFFGNLRVYCNSKLAVMMTSDVFAEKLKGTGVTSNSLHPGWVRTPIFDKFFKLVPGGKILNLLCYLLLHITGKSVWEGGQTTTLLACDGALENVTGKFFHDCVSFPKPWQARNRKLANELWRISEEAVGLLPEERIIEKYRPNSE